MKIYKTKLLQLLFAHKPVIYTLSCSLFFLLADCKTALTTSTSGGRSVGIVRLRTTGQGVCFLFVLDGKTKRSREGYHGQGFDVLPTARSKYV
jgi:hypothetical protein